MCEDRVTKVGEDGAEVSLAFREEQVEETSQLVIELQELGPELHKATQAEEEVEAVVNGLAVEDNDDDVDADADADADDDDDDADDDDDVDDRVDDELLLLFRLKFRLLAGLTGSVCCCCCCCRGNCVAIGL